MYKVILVDDEALILNAIKKNIAWNKLGFELCALAENGLEAIEKIRELHPDVVLTDIYMPFANGLKVAKYCAENHPGAKVVIITGYDEFSYARQALEYRVSNFILKPVTARQLSDILSKLREELDADRQRARDLEKIKDVYLHHLPVIISRFLNRLVCAGADMPDAAESLAAYDLHLDGACKHVALLRPVAVERSLTAHPEFSRELLLFVLYNVAGELSAEIRGTAFQNSEGETVLLFAHDHPAQGGALVTSQIRRINELLRDKFDYDIIGGLSSPVRELNELHDAYIQARRALEQHYTRPDDVVYHFENDKDGPRFQMSDFSARIEALRHALRVGARDEALRSLDACLDLLSSCFTGRSRILPYLQNLYMNLVRMPECAIMVREDACTDLAATARSRDSDFAALCRGFSEKIENCPLYRDARRLFVRLCLQILGLREHSGSDNVRRVSEAALEYIETEYMRPDLSINELCANLRISNSHFSAIFKEYSGETFVTALTRVRMENAARLLRDTGLKTYEIAERVGFEDPHYFGLVFKKHYGMTCRAYRRKLGAESAGTPASSGGSTRKERE